ncbi:MAG TPA: hypothetical protein VNU74_08610 [Terriglobales bacterium]|nr:hypothetical protein [Terriglobales bacterium]
MIQAERPKTQGFFAQVLPKFVTDVLIELVLKIGLCSEDVAEAVQGGMKFFEAGRAHPNGRRTENPLPNFKTARRGRCASYIFLASHRRLSFP